MSDEIRAVGQKPLVYSSGVYSRLLLAFSYTFGEY